MYLPLCDARIAPLAIEVPALKAIPPGTARLTISSVILPAVVASAISSKGFTFANHRSTSAALLVSAPRSIKVAPNETKPSGILIKPEARPAKIDCTLPTSLFSSPG